jgi:chemotaxis protein CheZ
MSVQRKLFAIEKAWAEQAAQRGGEAPGAGEAPMLAPSSRPDNDEILAAVAALSDKLDRFLDADRTDFDRIKVEVNDIAGRIQATKAEIAALRHPLEPNDKFLSAAAELGAVVSDAESATNTIMSEAEKVDAILGALCSQATDEDGAAKLASAGESIVRIFEACNFQDLTGQRIGKVTRTLTFIEGRVNAMLSLWNAKELEALPLPPSLEKVDNGLALHGPSGGSQQATISQNDIDSLFD